MKRLNNVVLLLLLLFSVITPVMISSPVYAAGPNLLPNGGMELVNLLDNGRFENGDPPTGWFNYRCIDSSEAVIFYEGSKSNKLVCNDGGSVGDSYLQSQVSVNAYDIYTLQSWVRGDSGNSQDGIRMFIQNAGDGWGSTYSSMVSPDDTWYKNSVTKTVGNVSSVFIKLFVDFHNPSGDSDDIAYFDNAILVEGTSVLPEWNQPYPNNTYPSQELTHSGSWSLALRYTTADIYASGTVPFSADYILEPFEASCWVWAGTANAARIGVFDGEKTTYSNYHTGGSGWEELTVHHTLDVGMPDELGIRLYASGTGTYWFDDAELFDATPDCPSNLDLHQNATTIDLSWDAPSDTGTVAVYAKCDGYPLYPGDGDLVYHGSGTTATHTDLSLINDFYYSAWGENWSGYSDCDDEELAEAVPPSWWINWLIVWVNFTEENFMIVALILLSAGLLVVGYFLRHPPLLIASSIASMIFALWAYQQRDSATDIYFFLFWFGIILFVLGILDAIAIDRRADKVYYTPPGDSDHYIEQSAGDLEEKEASTWDSMRNRIRQRGSSKAQKKRINRQIRDEINRSKG